MEYKVVMISIFMLLVCLSYSQNSFIRGKCIADNSKIEVSYVNVSFNTLSGKRFGTTAEIDGSFELKIGDEAGDIIIII